MFQNVHKITFYALFLFLFSCVKQEDAKRFSKTDTASFFVATEDLEDELKTYWYRDEAEITSYALKQARYGEIHEGKAVLIFVTEPFSNKTFTKADNPSKSDVSVLKLNFTKKFNTGIYPYSMMTSTFVPFKGDEPSIKVSSSVQEWCGHAYMELENKEKFEVQTLSYFEGENHKNTTLNKDLLEDDIWTMMRLNPNKLPTGEVKVIPSFFYLRLMHKELKAYTCKLSKAESEDNYVYSLYYPELERSLDITFSKSFPFQIESWKEKYESGFGDKKAFLETIGTKIKTIKSPYWQKHNNEDLGIRKDLGLE